jgi:cytochrome c-type biogenesis protein CcsB
MNPPDDSFQNAMSQGLFLSLFFILAVSWSFYLAFALTKKEVYGKWARRILWFALAWNAGALVYRWCVAGHAPWANQYESATMVAFGVLAIFSYFEGEAKLPILGLLVLPAAMVAIAAANLLPEQYKHMEPLVPALQSYWLKIHVTCMLTSYGAFASTFALSLLYLIKTGNWTRKTTWIALGIASPLAGWFFGYVHQSARSDFWNWLMASMGGTELAYGDTAKAYAVCAAGALGVGMLLAFGLQFLPDRLMDSVPAAETLDELNYRSVAIGFPLLTLGIILGAVWGHVAWGRYWGWDPKETWAFISWLVFAFFLHMRVFGGWEGRKIAWVGLIGAGSIVFTYWGVNFLLSGLHAYAKP